GYPRRGNSCRRRYCCSGRSFATLAHGEGVIRFAFTLIRVRSLARGHVRVRPQAESAPGVDGLTWQGNAADLKDRLKVKVADVSSWPIATDGALTASRRFRGIADMDGFSTRNEL